MAGFTDAVEQSLLNHFFTDPAYTPSTTMHVGLLTAQPTTDAGTGQTEVTGGSYARQPISGGIMNPATGSGLNTPASKANGTQINFPQATASWGVVTYFAIFDALTAGTLLAWGTLASPKTIDSGDTASFGVGDIVLKLGDPGDTY